MGLALSLFIFAGVGVFCWIAGRLFRRAFFRNKKDPKWRPVNLLLAIVVTFYWPYASALFVRGTGFQDIGAVLMLSMLLLSMPFTMSAQIKQPLSEDVAWVRRHFDRFILWCRYQRMQWWARRQLVVSKDVLRQIYTVGAGSEHLIDTRNAVLNRLYQRLSESEEVDQEAHQSWLDRQLRNLQDSATIASGGNLQVPRDPHSEESLVGQLAEQTHTVR